jgi:hypothetical protein
VVTPAFVFVSVWSCWLFWLVLYVSVVGGNKVYAALDLENVVNVAEIGCALLPLFEGG